MKGIALALCCFGLHYKTQTNNLETDLVSTTSFGGYVIILIGGFAGHLMSTPFNKRIDIFFSLVGCAMFVAAGAMNIRVFDNASSSEWRNMGLAKASLAIIDGSLFLLDSLLTWRGDF
ncbi:hypothetical protein JTB14_019454 [Gonioctena quinquepunctata]|nr:hypothetical protein JTB14_019454 [Gonioctena quinquepunctata]